MKYKKIIISAYSCSPNWGSEPGMSWNWVKNLAKHCKIHLITSCEFKDELLKGIIDYNLDDKISVYFNDIGEKATQMGKNQGDWRFYYYYAKWQKEAYRIALNIIKHNKIDLVHQLNMIGFREPGYLWKLDLPTVWGPLGGLAFIPNSFLKKAPIKIKYKAIAKNHITKLQLKYSRRVRSAFSNFDVIIGATYNSRDAIAKHLNIEIPVLNETGSNYTENKSILIRSLDNNEEFHLLWVGKSMFRKQLELALQVIKQVKEIDGLKLHIVGIAKGDYNYDKYQNMIQAYNIQSNIIWHGKILHKEVSKLMNNSHLFLFTSIVEGTPHVILEAIENNLPIICFDSCGQGDCVNDTIGIKIDLVNPEKAVVGFSKAITKLYNDRKKLQEFSINCDKRKKELSWDSKIDQMLIYYDEAIHNCNS